MNRFWIKLWIELLDDPKMGNLPDWQWRRFLEFCLVAGENGKDGLLPPVEQLAWRIRISEQKCRDALEALSQVGVVAQKPEGWIVCKFAKRQAKVETADRIREFRKANLQAPGEGEARVKGIYAIYCEPAKKVYIGGSIDVNKRIKVHFSEMKTGGERFSNDCKQYGVESFRAEILEVIEVGPIENAERKWIAQFKADGWLLYNGEDGKKNRYWNDDETTRDIDERRLTEEINRGEAEEESPAAPPPAPKFTQHETTQAVSSFHDQSAQLAERVYRQVTGQQFIPPNGDRDRALEWLTNILDYYKGDLDQATNAGRPIFAAWCNTKSKAGRLYSPTNIGWLDKWNQRLVPRPHEDTVASIADRIERDMERSRS